MRPRLFVVTGPSGAGKGTLIRALVASRPDLAVAVSATTRPRRPGEEDGRDYHFLSDEEFQRRVEAGDFLEHVALRLRAPLRDAPRARSTGFSSRAAASSSSWRRMGPRRCRPRRRDAVTIFIQAPSFDELERRLRERATESAGEIGERLDLARRQAREAGDFDHVVTNDDVAPRGGRAGHHRGQGAQCAERCR